MGYRNGRRRDPTPIYIQVYLSGDPQELDERRSPETRGLRLLPSILSEANLLGQRRALSGIIRGNHGVVSWQVPFRAVLIRGHPKSAEMSLKRLESLPIV